MFLTKENISMVRERNKIIMVFENEVLQFLIVGYPCRKTELQTHESYEDNLTGN